MKYPPATHILLFATVATSTIRPGLAVPRPGPASRFVRHPQSRQQRKTEHDSQSSPPSPPGLLVDGEGNLYSPRRVVTNESVQRRPEVSLRGGDVCVDAEGNFYTPKAAAASTLTSASTSPTTITPAASTLSSFPDTSTLRGGSHNHNIGGLGVDSEGNFFATQEQPGTPSSSKALFLRGGGLCVDNEGIFYTSRHQTVAAAMEPKQPTHSGSRRRRLKSNGSSNNNDAVLLTKNKTHKKPKKPSNGAVPMTFIGYNNALMET